eukprot:120656_1
MSLYKVVLFAFIYLANGYRYREDYDIHDMIREGANERHAYPPYYFSHKLWPRFSAYMMSKDDSMDDEENYSSRNQLTAFLLAFFLGSVGAGRFYIGAYLSASFKLMLGGIACLPCCLG